MKIEFRPHNVCCSQMNLEIEDRKIVNTEFYGGCEGNLKGISRLIRGMDIENVVNCLHGISCGGKNTSCPDQLSKCLIENFDLKKEKTEQKLN